MDIRCIENELKLITSRKKKVSSSKIIIYAFALIDLIDEIKKTHSIPSNFIKYIEIVKDSINCYIDINFLKLMKNNENSEDSEDNIIAVFCRPSYKKYSDYSSNFSSSSLSSLSMSSNSSISSSNSSLTNSSTISTSSSSIIDQSIDKKIQKMLKKDAEKIEKILNSDEINNENNELIKKAKILFDKFDKENDGILSSEDIIKIIQFNERHPLVFPCNVDDTFAYLLIVNDISNEKINFRQFLEHFL